MPSLQELKAQSGARSKRLPMQSETPTVTTKGTVPGRALYDKSPAILSGKRRAAPTQSSLQYRKEREQAQQRLLKKVQKQPTLDLPEELNDIDDEEDKRTRLVEMIRERDDIDYNDATLDDLEFEELQEMWNDPQANHMEEQEGEEEESTQSYENPYDNIRQQEAAPLKKCTTRRVIRDENEECEDEESANLASESSIRAVRPARPLTNSTTFNVRSGLASENASRISTPSSQSMSFSPREAIATKATLKRVSDSISSSAVSTESGDISDPPQKRQRTRNTTLAPTSSEDGEEEKRSKRKPKPKVSDFEGHEAEAVARSIKDFTAWLCAVDAFPETSDAQTWAREAWARANAYLLPNEPAYPFTLKVKQVILLRVSWIRGVVRDRIRDMFMLHYGFKKGSPDEVKEHNVELYEKLHNKNAFTCLEISTRRKYYENTFICEALAAALFRNTHDVATSFESYFDPIPLETIALIVTVTEYCSQEWSSGVRKQGRLDGSVHGERYQKHIESLRTFQQTNPLACARIQKYLYQYCRDAVGIKPSTNEQQPELTAEDFGVDDDASISDPFQ